LIKRDGDMLYLHSADDAINWLATYRF